MVNEKASPLIEALVPCLEECEQVLSDLRRAHVFIVGGGGFVGLWLTEAILACNDLFAFDARVTIQTLSDTFLRKYAPHIAGRKDVTVVCTDCRNTVIPETASYIFYAAVPTNPLVHQSYPTEIASVVTDGLRAMFESAQLLSGIRKVLFLSSGMIYGPQPYGTERQAEDTFNPFDPSVLEFSFSESLRFAESLCSSYRNECRLPVVIARGFAFIGPYQLPTIAWALHNFIGDAINGRPIRILGDGESIRSYLYGADAAVWLLRLLVQGRSGSVYNVGSPYGIRLVEAAEIVSQRFGHRSPISLLGESHHLRRTRFVPDVARIEKEFGVCISVPVERAIEKTIDWMLGV